MDIDINEVLTTLLGLGNFGAVLAVFLVVLYKINDITSIHDYLTSRKIKAVKEALETGVVTERSADYLKESIEDSLYKRFEGVKWDKPFREKLLKLRDDSNGQITMKMLKRADVFIMTYEGSPVIRISCFEKFLLNLLMLIGFILLFTVFVLTVLIVVWITTVFASGDSEIKDIISTLIIYGLSLIITVLGAFSSLKEAQSLNFAIQIDKELSRNSQYQSQVETCNLPALYKSLLMNIKNIFKSIISFVTG